MLKCRHGPSLSPLMNCKQNGEWGSSSSDFTLDRVIILISQTVLRFSYPTELPSPCSRILWKTVSRMGPWKWSYVHVACQEWGGLQWIYYYYNPISFFFNIIISHCSWRLRPGTTLFFLLFLIAIFALSSPLQYVRIGAAQASLDTSNMQGGMLQSSLPGGKGPEGFATQVMVFLYPFIPTFGQCYCGKWSWSV